ncbi:MAG: DUF1330 domain-containing protein [Gemmatimonadota bacterium]
MALEMLVGLNVTDDEAYAEYRAEMMPILARFGGSFGYDFRVSDVLRPETGSTINRVFTIRFPDAETMSSFFADEDYLGVKAGHFERSVEDTVIIATYEPR